MSTAELLWAIGRATVFTSASAIAAIALLQLLKVRSTTIHRAAWILVAFQGWVLMPWTWQIESPPVTAPMVTVQVEPTQVAATAWQAMSSPRSAARVAEVSPAGSILVVWLCGMAALIVMGVYRYLRFLTRVGHTEVPADAAWQHELERQLSALNVRRRAKLLVTQELGPLLCFIPWRYLVIVPRPLWVGLERRQRIAILRHELAHLQRGDLWWSLVIRALALAQWFNPLVWLAVRRFDETGEWACDDSVSRGRRSHELAFARSLLATAEFATANSPGTVGIQGGKLAQRVRRLVSKRFKEEAMSKKLFALVPLLAIVFMQSIRIERVTAEEPPLLPRVADATPRTESKSTPSPSRSIPPSYVIEPPDVLLINAVKLVPKPPHKIEPFDGLLVRVLGALPDHPISDAFAVDPDGKIDLGPAYGRVKVGGLTVEEAQQAIEQHLKQVLQDPRASVSLASSAGAQQITGEHLVGPDGRVYLGTYGTVHVSGMTIDEARTAIESQLAKQLQDPRVSVDVIAYNSKKYYVITHDDNGGDNVCALPITGNETVLDAVAQMGGVPQRSNKIWVARPAPNGVGMERILPVNWEAISQGKSTATNYQLLPGDRIFIKDVTKPKIDDAPQYCFEIDMIEDPHNELAAFDAKRGDAPFAAFDSDTIRPALRIMSKHQLIKKLSSPKLTCFAGQTATLEMGGSDNEDSLMDGLKLHVFAGEFDRGLVVQLKLDCDHQGQHYECNSSIPVQVGKTILVRANAGDWQSPEHDAPPLYVALTPAVVKAMPPENILPAYDQSP
jgi:polysaccharide export outer membrane protein